MPASYALPQAHKSSSLDLPEAPVPAEEGELQSKPMVATEVAPAPESLQLGFKITLRRSCLNSSIGKGDYRFGVGIKYARPGTKTDGPFLIVGFHDQVRRSAGLFLVRLRTRLTWVVLAVEYGAKKWAHSRQ